MKIISRRINASLVLSVSFVSVFLSACSEMKTTDEKISEAESCNRLKAVIDDHPNQFKNYRKHLIVHKRYSSWTADKILPGAKNCHVWEWSTGLYNYYCEWKADEGENQALANYQQAANSIQKCLGTSWTAKTNPTQSGGERTVYSQAGSATIVSLRYYKEKAGWYNNWFDAIIVGDKSNLNTPMQ